MSNENITPDTHRCYGCFAPSEADKKCIHCGYDETSPRSPISLPPGELLQDKYTVGRLMGNHGVTGFCYLAWDKDLQKTVSIKEYLPRGLAGRNLRTRMVTPHAEKEAVFTSGLDRFQRQSRQLVHVDHANVIKVRNVFEQYGTLYVVCDYHRGETLQSYIEESDGKIDFEEAKNIIHNILEGLSHAHKLNVTHQFIDARHLRYSRIGEYVLTSFGEHRTFIESDISNDKSRIVDGNFVKKPDLLAITNLFAHLIGIDLDRANEIDGDTETALLHMRQRIIGTNVASPITSCRHLSEAISRLADPAEKAAAAASFASTDSNTKHKALIGGIAVVTALVGIVPKLGLFEQSAPVPVAQTQYIQPASEFAAIHEQLEVPQQAVIETPEPVVVQQIAPTNDTVEQTPVAVVEEKPAEIEPETVVNVDPEPIYDEKTQKIEQLLAEGDKLFKDLWLTKPEGNSALDKYKAVLELDESNSDAVSGLMKISDYFADQAKKAIKAGKLDLAENYLTRSEEVVADRIVVAEMYTQIEDKRRKANEWKEKANQSKQLVAEAKRYIKNKQFSAPKSANALDALRTALKLNSSNSDARKLINSLSEKLSAEFSIAVLDRDINEAKSLYDQAKRFKSLKGKLSNMSKHVSKLEQAKKSVAVTPKDLSVSEKLALEKAIKPLVKQTTRSQVIVSVVYENGNSRTSAFGIGDNGETVLPNELSDNRYLFIWPEDSRATTLIFENKKSGQYEFDWPVSLSYVKHIKRNQQDIDNRKVVSLYINNHQMVSNQYNFTGLNDIKPKVLLDSQLAKKKAHENIRDDLYLRGNMNGWGTSLPLNYQGGFEYAVSADMFEEYYEFKFGDENWSGDANYGAMFRGKTKGLAIGANSQNLRLSVPQGAQGEFKYALFTIPLDNGRTYNLFRVERQGKYKPAY